jgi:beta-barrel assembly-enhancing protease
MSAIKVPFLLGAMLLVFLSNSCSEGGGVNIFSIEDDIALGAQMAAEIEVNNSIYPILDSADNAKAYQHLYDIRNTILASGAVVYKDAFPWQIRIIHNDSVQNAFCTPGGYIYVYTGLIKYLSDESQLAGVIGHEMAHADLRHSTDQLTKAYGISLLLGIILGNQENLVAEVVASLTQLAFSRSDEEQADEYSVRYLCPTHYVASGSAGFFEKIEHEGQSEMLEFLSTHPNPKNRVNNIKKMAAGLPCEGEKLFEDRHNAIIALLPKN